TRSDDSVRGILLVKIQAGLFENARPNPAISARFNQPEFRQTNLEAAREAITLLKNENNVLPLRRGSKILVTGPAANMLSVLNGGWSLTWQGDAEEQYPKEKLTMLRALEAAAGQ